VHLSDLHVLFDWRPQKLGVGKNAAKTKTGFLITWRSQVQILPPQPSQPYEQSVRLGERLQAFDPPRAASPNDLADIVDELGGIVTRTLAH
jgi:hypothetical protein